MKLPDKTERRATGSSNGNPFYTGFIPDAGSNTANSKGADIRQLMIVGGGSLALDEDGKMLYSGEAYVKRAAEIIRFTETEFSAASWNVYAGCMALCRGRNKWLQRYCDVFKGWNELCYSEYTREYQISGWPSITMI